MIYLSVEELIGKTPLFMPMHWNRLRGNVGDVLCKLEGMNPAGSAKDRVALYMLNDAESLGLLKPGATVIEPTSGNTGIGLASLCAARGYHLILTMPDTMSEERIRLLKAYGAEVVLTPGAEGMQGSVKKAKELSASIPGSFIPSQFDNPNNPDAHFSTTGPEIWEDAGTEVDVFIAGIGTGGTLTGTGRYLKSKNPACRIIGIEPATSPLLTKGVAGKHDLQGIGANFVPENFDRSVCDEILTVTDEEAYTAARQFAKTEGILVGITSGAALHAASIIAKDPAYKEKKIVALLPDAGDRYLSTKLFADQ